MPPEEAENQGFDEESRPSEEQQSSDSDQARNSGQKSSNQTGKTGHSSSNKTGKTGQSSSNQIGKTGHSSSGSGGGIGGSSGLGGMARDGADQAKQEITKQVTKQVKSQAWKWIAGGGIGFGGVAGFLVILLLLILMKNIAIRDLFMDYEFAKFDRIFSERIQEAIKEANAKGTEDTKLTEETAPGTETPETNLDQASAADIKVLKDDEDNPSEENDFNQAVENFDQSPLAPDGTKIMTEFGLDYDAADDTGETDQQAEADTTAAFEADVDGSATPTAVPSGDAGVDQAEAAADTAAEAPGATDASIQDSAIKAFSGGATGVISKASGPLFFITLACIAVDIYDKLFAVIQQFQLAGLVRTASAGGTYADCQKLGKCSLSQDGAVAKEYDNGTQSVTQSAGYERATGHAVNPANDLDASLRPGDPPVGGTIGQLLSIGEHVDHTMADLGIPSVCSAILNPIVQAAMAVLNIGVTIVAALTGAIDLGASDVATAVVETTAIIAGSKIGTALVIHAAMALSQTAFKNLNPVQLGNATDAGWKVRATDTCRYAGCRQLTPAENQQETLDAQNAQIQTLDQQSIAYRLFSVNNPYSVADLTVMQIPTSPDAIVASMQTVIGNITNPSVLLASVKSFAAAIMNPTSALAADTTTIVESDTYGIPDYGLPDAEVNEWSIADNTAWVAQNMPAYTAWAKVCLTPSFNQIMMDESSRAGNIVGANAGAEDECSAMDIPDRHFRLYTLDLEVTGDLAMVFNNNTGN